MKIEEAHATLEQLTNKQTTSALRLPIHTNRKEVKTTGGQLHINHNQI